LEGLIRAGKFRGDLYYRLNVIDLTMPSLRQRPEDIPELALNFLKHYARRCGKEVEHLDDDVLAILKAYSWPGNVRELENVLERAVVVTEGNTIGVADLPLELVKSIESADAAAEAGAGEDFDGLAGGWQAERDERARRERERLVRALAAADGNKAEAARALGLARSTLLSRLKKYGLS
jgi:DNA-binding NtrC family response regulator